MNIKLLVRETLEKLARKCGDSGYIVFAGEKYKVGKMFYGEYFIELYEENKTEKDRFHENTMWERCNFGEILQFLLDEKLINLK